MAQLGSRAYAVSCSFQAVYKEECAKCRVNQVTLMSADASSLDVCVDEIREQEWRPILEALRVDKTLKVVVFKSSFLSNHRTLLVLCCALCENENVRVLSLCDCQLGGETTSLMASLLQQQSLGCQGPLRRSTLRLDLLWGLRRCSLCNNPLGNEGSAPWLKLLRTTSASRHLTFRAAISAMMVAALANLLRKNVVLEEDLRQCQESLRRAQKDIKILKGKLLELAEENRQLRSEECKRCQQQAGYSLVPDSLLKEIERALLIFKHLIPVGKHTENRNPVETVAARHDVQVPGQVLQKESVPSSSKGSVADPSAPKPPNDFDGF
ncbi:hypothetical protein MRX96_006744 [Rhipicephalus microplus]